MNYYDQQLQELLAQCARKRKLEASAAELLRQRDTSADERPSGRRAEATLEDAPRPPVRETASKTAN